MIRYFQEKKDICLSYLLNHMIWHFPIGGLMLMSANNYLSLSSFV